MSDKNFKVKNGIDASDKLTITNTSGLNNLIEVNGASGGQFSISAYGGISTNAGFTSNGGASNFGGYGGIANVVINVTGASGQTADLQRWNNFGGTTLAKIDASGSISAVDLTLSGNLTVNGTTTNLNSTNLIIEDKNIVIADVATPTDTTADGAGITIKGATDKTFNWVQSTGSFTSSEPLIINTNSITKSNLILKAISSQTADLQQWQDSSGIVKSYISSTGTIAVGTTTNSAFPMSVGTKSGNPTAYGLAVFRDGQPGQYIHIHEFDGSKHIIETQSISAKPFLIYNNQAESLIFGTNATERLRITSAGLLGINQWTPSAQIHVNSSSTSTIGIIVQAYSSSQTADLQQWQDSAGTVSTRIYSDGSIGTTAGRLVMVQDLSAQANIWSGSTARTALFVGGSVTAPSQVIRQATSQTSNLQEWQDSTGAILAKVDPSGHITTTGYVALGLTGGLVVGGGYFIRTSYTTTSPAATITSPSSTAGQVVLAVKGAVSQTANLQEWQNSSGTNVAYVTSGGAIQGGTYNGVTIGLNYPGIVLDTGSSANTQVWLRNTSASTSSGIFAGIKARFSYADAVSGDDLVTLSGQQYQGGTNYESGKILISSDGTPSSSSRPARITFHTVASGSTTVTERMRIGNSGTVTINGFDSASIGLIVKAAASQTANLQEWQNSSGTTLGKIDAEGSIYSANRLVSPGDFESRSNSYFGSPSFSGGTVVISTRATTQSGIVIRGVASQTANLQEWQNSAGTVAALITSGGDLIIPGSRVAIGSASVRSVTMFYANSAGASFIPIVAQGAASQTANLQEWQNSSGTVLAKIASDGSITSSANLTVNTITATNGTSLILYGNITSNGADGSYINVQGNQNNTLGSGRTLIQAGNTGQNGLVVKAGGAISGSITAAIANGTTIVYTATNGFNAGPKYVAVGQTITVTGIVSTGNPTGTAGSGFNVVNAVVTSATLTTLTVTTALTDTYTSGGTFTTTTNGLTGDLQQWQNSAGTTLLRVNSAGQIQAPLPTSQGLIVKAATTLTATITNAVGSAGTVTYTANNTFAAGQTVTITGVSPAAYNLTSVVIASASATQFTVTNAATGTYVSGGTATVAQSVNLQEWQDSAGTILAKVDTTGILYTGQTLSSMGGDLILNDTTGRVFRSVRASAWADSLSSRFYQIGVNNDSIAFTANVGTNASRMLFGSAQSAFHDGSYTTAPVISAVLSVISNTTTKPVLITRGAASQTADLQQWQDSAGSVKAFVNSAGAFISNQTIGSSGYMYAVSPASFGSSGLTNSYQVQIINGSTTRVALMVQAIASQTADLTQWQNSAGTVLAKIDANGIFNASAYDYGVNTGYPQIVFGGINTSASIRREYRSSVSKFGITTGTFHFGSNPDNSNFAITDNQVGIFANSTSLTTLIVKAAASQTANLQQWQDSSGTVLGYFNAYGQMAYAQQTLTQTNPGAIVSRIFGAASQTADLQQWINNSSTILAKLDASGNFSAVSKSFDISHPTKENMRLRYASLEGPENGVYIRGTAESNIIELPDYWTGLVHEDSITVSLTAVGSAQNIYVEKIEDNKVYIGGELTKAFFTVYGERKDIDKLTVEY